MGNEACFTFEPSPVALEVARSTGARLLLPSLEKAGCCDFLASSHRPPPLGEDAHPCATPLMAHALQNGYDRCLAAAIALAADGPCSCRSRVKLWSYRAPHKGTTPSAPLFSLHSRNEFCELRQLQAATLMLQFSRIFHQFHAQKAALFARKALNLLLSFENININRTI